MGPKCRRAYVLFTLLLASASASAVQTNWEFQGRLTAATGSQVPADFLPGTPFRVVVGFDTGATLDAAIPGSAGGTRYNYSSPMRFLIYLGTTCAPCDISGSAGWIFLRDDFSNLVGDPPAAEPAVDGISLGVQDGDTSIGVVMRGPVLDIVNGPAIPVAPDPRLADLAIAVFQVCAPFPGTPPDRADACSEIELSADIESVRRPSFGTGYIFTSRDCSIPTGAADPLKNDCFNVGNFFGTGNRVQTWSFPGSLRAGGGVGTGGISYAFTPTVADIDPSWEELFPGAYAINARLALSIPVVPPAPLGSLFGSISFGGPVALPVVKGMAIPSAVSRSNTNLYAYQAYNYSGGVTSLPLVLDLTYEIDDNSSDPAASPFIGQRPGGAEIGATLAIVDNSVSLEQVYAASVNPGLNSLLCGEESNLGWPAGSILGVASFRSTAGEEGPQARTVEVRDCDDPGMPVQLAAGQDFTVTAAMQTPARGLKAQPSSGGFDAPANGYVDAANTMRVRFSESAPPALIQQLVADIAPGCDPNCDFPSIDIKPGDDANCIKPDSKAVVPVALLGTASFNVRDVVVGSLQFGKLAPTVLKNGKYQCDQSDVNLDGIKDLVCQFRNSADNWNAGQTVETLRGQAAGGAFEASDRVCLSN